MEREKWNRRYSQKGPELNSVPTPWLADHRDLLPSPATVPSGGTRGGETTRALDLACGTGKNAFFLAELGWHVDALDISDVGLEQLSAEAERRDLAERIAAHRVDLRREDIDDNGYAVIVCFRYLERRLFPQIEGALVPGGLVLVETFTRRDPEVSGRSFPPELLLDEGELAGSFPALETVVCRERTIDGPSGSRHVASLVARRPTLP